MTTPPPATPSAAGNPITVTVTVGSNIDTTTYSRLGLAGGRDVPTGQTAIGAQVMRITGSINAAAGTIANLRFVLRGLSRVYKYVDVTAAVSAVRTGTDGASGDYVLTITGTSDDFIDLTGHNGLGEGHKDDVAWYVGAAGAFGGAATSLTLCLFPIRAN